MADDKTYRIRIDTIGDASGAQAVGGALEDLSARTRAHGEAVKDEAAWVDKSEYSHRQLRQALSMISPELGELSHNLHLLEAGPMLGLILAAGLLAEGLRKVREKMEEEKKAAAEMGTEMASALSKGLDSAAKLREEAIEGKVQYLEEMAKLAEAQSTAEAKTQRQISAIKDEGEALHRLMKIREDYELSQAPDEASKSDIRRRYAAGSNTVDVEALRRELALRQAELNGAVMRSWQLESDRATAEQAYYGEHGRRARSNVEERTAEKDRLEKQLASQQAIVNSMQGIGPNDAGYPKYLKAVAELDSIKASLESVVQIITKDRLTETDLKTAMDGARTLAVENQKLIEAGNAALPGMVRNVNSRAAAAGLAADPAGGLLASGAEALAELAKHHGRVNELAAQQVQNIRALTAFLSSMGMNNATFLRLLEQSNGNDIALFERLKTIEARQAQISRQIGDLSGQVKTRALNAGG